MPSDVFYSLPELRGSPWYAYLHAVYGAATITFPVDLAHLAYFHARLLPASIRHSIPVACTDGGGPEPCDPGGYRYGDIKPGAYPLHEGDLWRSFRAVNRRIDRTLQTVMTRGLPSHARVEVTHTCCDPPSKDGRGRSQGLWMYLNPGSGIWFDLGNTFVSNRQGWVDVRRQTGCKGDFHDAIACFRRTGLDSIQMPHIYERGTKLYEILNLQDTHYQEDGCFDPLQSSGKYWKGYDASIPCVCRREGYGWRSPLNCNG